MWHLSFWLGDQKGGCSKAGVVWEVIMEGHYEPTASVLSGYVYGEVYKSNN